MKKLLFLIGVLFAGVFYLPDTASAVGLKVAPLEYRTTLKKGEAKKGFIDASNPTDQPVRIRTSAQAFRQVDDSGSLQFYDDEQVRAGVQLDLDEFELGPREAIRMYFQLDGTKLPSGDVFAAIFFTTEPTKPSVGVGQSVRLGTLLSIVNGTPGSREAEITELVVPWLQFSSEVKGSYTIKNTADPERATGFYPQVQLWAAPIGPSEQSTGKLVFAGRSRQNEFSLKLLPLGVYKIQASYDDTARSRWVIVASPVATGLAVVAIALSVTTWHFYRRNSRSKSAANNTRTD